MSNITDKIIGGTFWVSVLKVGQKGFGAVKQIILARLLFPEDFGLFGIASLMLLAFEVLTRTGFDDALIHIQEKVEAYLHTSYWIQVIRGLVIGLIVYLGASTIAEFFNEPRVIPIVQVLALTQVIKGFRSIGVVLLRKEMDFYSESIFLFTGVFTNFIVTVSLAFLWQDVWALVWGSVAAEAVMVVTSFYFHDYRPSFLFSGQKAKELFEFGVWLLGAGIVSYIALQADNIFVGKIIGARALGLYQMAYFVANLPTTEIVKQVGKVVQSSYAEVQQDTDLLMQTYRKTFSAICVVLIPAIIGLMLISEEIVLVILGDKWTDIIPILPVLAVGALFRGLGVSAASLFKATGLTSNVFRVEATRGAALLVGLVICSYLNTSLILIGWAYVGSTIIMFIYHMILYEKTYNGAGALLSNVWPVLISGGILAICTAFLSSILSNGILNLLVIIFAGVLIYSVSILLLEKKTGNEIVLKVLKKYGFNISLLN